MIEAQYLQRPLLMLLSIFSTGVPVYIDHMSLFPAVQIIFFLINHLCQKFIPFSEAYIQFHIDAKTKKSDISNGKDNINLK